MTDNFTLAHCNSTIRMRAIHYIDDEVCKFLFFSRQMENIQHPECGMVHWYTGNTLCKGKVTCHCLVHSHCSPPLEALCQGQFLSAITS